MPTYKVRRDASSAGAVLDAGYRFFIAAGAICGLNRLLFFTTARTHKGGDGPSRAYPWIDLPLARSLKGLGPPAEGIQHITLFIGYDNRTPSTLVKGFDHLA